MKDDREALRLALSTPKPELANEILALRAENERLRDDVRAFCGAWAVEYAKRMGYPGGHIHPKHYDTLEQCGARMDGFTRALKEPSDE